MIYRRWILDTHTHTHMSVVTNLKVQQFVFLTHRRWGVKKVDNGKSQSPKNNIFTIYFFPQARVILYVMTQLQPVNSNVMIYTLGENEFFYFNV